MHRASSKKEPAQRAEQLLIGGTHITRNEALPQPPLASGTVR